MLTDDAHSPKVVNLTDLVPLHYSTFASNVFSFLLQLSSFPKDALWNRIPVCASIAADVATTVSM